MSVLPGPRNAHLHHISSNNVPTLTAVLKSSSEALLLAPGRLVMLRRLELRGERMLDRECFRDCDGAPIGEDGMGEDGGDMAMSMARLFHLYSQTIGRWPMTEL